MKIGLIGLGRMGSGIRDRLRRHGHEVVGYDRDPELSDTSSVQTLVRELDAPRIVWVMVPAGDPTEQTVRTLGGLLFTGDLVIEGGNSHYRDSIRRADELRQLGIDYVDLGVSGGVWGLSEGFCLMAGGTDEAIGRIRPLMESLAAEGGQAHVGPSGSGHFTKMVHNGIEYGMLQAYAEGFDMLAAYDHPIDMRQVASLWNHGSVVRSWLLELAERAFERNPSLEGLEAYVDDSGEGRWMVQDAVDRAVPAGVVALSLFSRFASRQENSFGLRVIAALRNEFGGHEVKRT